MKKMSETDRFTVQHAAELYGYGRWGAGYFTADERGHLRVVPARDPDHSIDVLEVVRLLAERGLHTPLLLRFPQLLTAQVERLAGAFARAIREFEYQGRFRPVFPIKVNQQRSVVDGLIRAGRPHGIGLEVGSRSELLAAMALDLEPGSLVICNGFKDRDYLASAALAMRLGHQVVVVIEKPFELEAYFDMVRRGDPLPWVGMRVRLESRGSGLWEKSGGFASKFGLTTHHLLDAVRRFEEAGLAGRLALLHFHIGSQVTEIRKVKNAVREAARVYAKLRRCGSPFRYLDIGGGLGIDYDGSRTSSDASVNYSVQEYANDVVFGVHEVCAEENVPAPTIVSESGRMLTAYHAMLVTDVRGVISPLDGEPPETGGGRHQVVEDLAETFRGIGVKNYREFYHDALEYRDQLHTLFGLGLIDLEERAMGESYFWAIAVKAARFSKTAKFVAEEFQALETKLHAKYICNFSVFQSMPDHWALDQLFPVLPIHRLDERPTQRAKLVDITCDSDGEVEKFVDLKDIKEALEVHEVREGEPYYLGFALVGAYQDTMGDLHNLFGRVHEAEAMVGEDGRVALGRIREGDRARDTLFLFGYGEEELIAGFEAALERQVARGELAADAVGELSDQYRYRLGHYTYLD